MCSILAIDDDKDVLAVIRQALTKFGHQVDTAADGHEGIQKFNQGVFDVVITDIQMPIMDGNGVVQHIRNSNQSATPVIAITGNPWLPQNSDFDMILPKPFPILKLVESVKRLSQDNAL